MSEEIGLLFSLRLAMTILFLSLREEFVDSNSCDKTELLLEAISLFPFEWFALRIYDNPVG